ncbi:uncharacterized protein LOC132561420 [Ylistrum balloti]|uniref:uncharacterized protein LOC132561420 n=1 Tax=Ylistrum balloti TaxID=509963 RepID=UPI002905C72D|nr:uncharacterized protein LOC132561420 [Ylistrum balloti]
MADQGELYEKSWILRHVLDWYIESQETVAIVRKLKLLSEKIENSKRKPTQLFYTGSGGEGSTVLGSDTDMMFAYRDVIVLYPGQAEWNPSESSNETILIMRDADSRPGYVTLELLHLGKKAPKCLIKAVCQQSDKKFISSEIFTQSCTEEMDGIFQLQMESHGPAATIRDEHSNTHFDADTVLAFSFHNWPKEAEEWVCRPRFHNWPDKTLMDQIVQGGCHIVPVGDKTSDDPFLQWRISFVIAERKLIHSLNHVQFLVYGLFKCVLKQISEMLKQLLGNTEILSSYIVKTVILHAVENTPESLWQEKHTFLCFMFCLNTLISWVKAGYCPNYFITNNNMFLGKVHGQNQTKLVRFLIDFHDMKWSCLSVGTFLQPTIGEIVDDVCNGGWEIITPSPTDCDSDVHIIGIALKPTYPADLLSVFQPLLSESESESDTDEFLDCALAARVMWFWGMVLFEKHTAVRGNKQKYKYLRKCRNLLSPFASICKSPGSLMLATYYYQIGNYMKALELCGNLISSPHVFLGLGTYLNGMERYEDLYCGRGYTLIQKSREVFLSNIVFMPNAPHFCPPQLHEEVAKDGKSLFNFIPPLPYAVFLSFLCYHELGDIRRRDIAMRNLRAVKYDREQGVGQYWIVHNFLGICYEIMRDKGKALREYRNSLGVRNLSKAQNPAKKKIQRLQKE